MRATIRQRGTARMVLRAHSSLSAGRPRPLPPPPSSPWRSARSCRSSSSSPGSKRCSRCTSTSNVSAGIYRCFMSQTTGGSTSRCGSASTSPGPGPTLSSAGISCWPPRSTSCRPRSAARSSSWSLIGVLHVVFINRIRIARAFAATQRAQDLERFETLRREQEQAPHSPQRATNKVICAGDSCRPRRDIRTRGCTDLSRDHRFVR